MNPIIITAIFVVILLVGAWCLYHQAYDAGYHDGYLDAIDDIKESFRRAEGEKTNG